MTEVKTYEMTAEEIKKYSFRLDDDGNILEEINDPLDTEGMLARALGGGGGGQTLPSQEIHNRAVAYTHKHPDVDYRRAVDIVMVDDQRLVHAYAAEHGTPPRIYTQGATPHDDPSVKLARKAENLVASDVVKTFSEGVRRAIEDNPKLGERWKDYVSCGR